MTTDKVTLHRVLNTPLVTLYGLGVTVGAGIYVLVGATAATAGTFAPIAFAVAAVVVAFTAFSYAELSTRFPVSAGEAAFVDAGFGVTWLSTIVGLAVATSGVVSSAAIAKGAASYIQSFASFDQSLITVLVVMFMCGIALWGIAQSVMVAAIITVIEIGGLLLVVIWGVVFADPLGAEISEMIPPLVGPHWIGIGAASLLAFFAFVGFEDMVNVAEEVKDPRHTMPRAIIWTLVLATILYICTVAATLVAVPLPDLANADAPLSLVFANGPTALQSSFSGIAVVATVNGVLIQMIMASRVLYGLADRGQLPKALAYIAPRTKAPSVATLTVTVVIILLTITLPIETLAERTSQIVLMVFVLVNVALIRLKLNGPSKGEHFCVPLIVPALGVVTSLLLFATTLL